MNSPDLKRSIAWTLIAGLLVIYVIAPMIAGVFPNVDRRGPKIFWVEHHELLCTLAHEFVYDTKPRPGERERAWFYGLKGKPNTWIEAKNALDKFEGEVDETTFLEVRRSMWKEGSGHTPVALARAAWPQSFATNGVLEVRRERHGILVVLERRPDHEAGIFLLANLEGKKAVENDPAYSRGLYWKSGVYHFYRKVKH